jgi:hypothetical protein
MLSPDSPFRCEFETVVGLVRKTEFEEETCRTRYVCVGVQIRRLLSKVIPGVENLDVEWVGGREDLR